MLLTEGSVNVPGDQESEQGATVNLSIGGALAGPGNSYSWSVSGLPEGLQLSNKATLNPVVGGVITAPPGTVYTITVTMTEINAFKQHIVITQLITLRVMAPTPTPTPTFPPIDDSYPTTTANQSVTIDVLANDYVMPEDLEYGTVNVTSASSTGETVSTSFADGSTYHLYKQQEYWTGTLGSGYTWSAANLPYIGQSDGSNTRTIAWGGTADGTNNQFALFKDSVLVAVGTSATYSTVIGTVQGASNFKLESGSFDVELIPVGAAGLGAMTPPHSHLHIGLELVDGLYDEGDPAPNLHGADGMTVGAGDRTGLEIVGWQTNAETHGTVDWNSDHTQLVYTPDPHFDGIASFTYTVSYNGTPLGHSATVTINVQPDLLDPLSDLESASFDLALDSNNDGELTSADAPIEEQLPGQNIMVNTRSELDSLFESDAGFVELRISLTLPTSTTHALALGARIQVTEGSQLVRLWRDRDGTIEFNPQSDILFLAGDASGAFYSGTLFIEAIGSGVIGIEGTLVDDSGSPLTQQGGTAKKDKVKATAKENKLGNDFEAQSPQGFANANYFVAPTYNVPLATIAGKATSEQKYDEMKRLVENQLSQYLPNLEGSDVVKGIQYYITNGKDADAPKIEDLFVSATYGYSGWVVAYAGRPVITNGVHDFTSLKIVAMPVYWVNNEDPQYRHVVVVKLLGLPGERLMVSGPPDFETHEQMHTDGIPAAFGTFVNNSLETYQQQYNIPVKLYRFVPFRLWLYEKMRLQKMGQTPLETDIPLYGGGYREGLSVGGAVLVTELRSLNASKATTSPKIALETEMNK